MTADDMLHSESFCSFLYRTRADTEPGAPPGQAAALTEPSATPEEQIAAASGALDESLRDALLTRILEVHQASSRK